MATPSKAFLITWVFVFHYYPSEFDGSIISVPNSKENDVFFLFFSALCPEAVLQKSLNACMKQ